MTIEDVCTFINMQIAARPVFMTSVLSTCWALPERSVPEDLYVYDVAGTYYADLVCILNGMFIESGKRMVQMRAENSFQYIVEKI